MKDDEIMTPAMVARLFKVSPTTVSRWAKQGKLKSFKTLGGHRRFRRQDVMEVTNGQNTEGAL